MPNLEPQRSLLRTGSPAGDRPKVPFSHAYVARDTLFVAQLAPPSLPNKTLGDKQLPEPLCRRDLCGSYEHGLAEEVYTGSSFQMCARDCKALRFNAA